MPDLKILITGGLGYLGGRIADSLKRNHPESTILLGTSRNISRIPDWAKPFQIVPLDILDPTSIENAISSDIQAIIHLAALNEHDSFSDIKRAWETNTLGTQNLLSVANQKQIKKLIYFSTFHVYGDCKGRITENSPTRPHHPYAATHRAAEDMVRFFQHYKGMDTLTLRLSNGFGYPMDSEVNRWTLVFNDLCRQAMTSGKMIIQSSGKQHRDFISLHDVAAAVDYFLYAIPDKWADGLFNLGGDCSLSIAEVANKIAMVYEKRYGKPIPIEIAVKDNGESHDPVQFNIDKLKKIGFHLMENMEREIEETLSLCEKLSK
ncbi:MAG: NAD(P)-dependent oxidoreductase [Nitrospinae bacterium]|nr:NAD(P)-dependent oxidoreductase [Nitrospinota bacterium]